MKTAIECRYVKPWLNSDETVRQDQMDKLKDKVVLITGAGKGSGRLLAQAFAEQGAVVAANDVSPVNVEEVVDQILAKGGQAKAYIDDVAKKVAVQNIINQVEDDFGHIDILINHAAVEPNIPLLEMDEWDWHRTLDVNLTGAFLMTQSMGRVMRLRGLGVIINLITEPNADDHNKAAFIASMRGLDTLTRQAARELRPYGIRVYAVANVQGKIVETVFALLDLQLEER
jgi:NAD(P)-dependent dehydrogenase (short-subunit alcohol dehydrogenase family)